MKKSDDGAKKKGVSRMFIEEPPQLFKDFMRQYDFMLNRQKEERKREKAEGDCSHFLCMRCGKKIPYADGGAVADIRYDKCWSMILKKAVEKYDKVAICIPCLREVMQMFGFQEKDILKFAEGCTPKYILGEYKLVDATKDKPKPNTKGTDNMKAKADTTTKPKRERKRKPLTKEKKPKNVKKVSAKEAVAFGLGLAAMTGMFKKNGW